MTRAAFSSTLKATEDKTSNPRVQRAQLQIATKWASARIWITL
jgi:hypothetical protein